jgi:hypothetical protein
MLLCMAQSHVFDLVEEEENGVFQKAATKCLVLVGVSAQLGTTSHSTTIWS